MRIKFIHEQLKKGKFPNCHGLSAALEVKAPRTILRDIQFMMDQLRLPIQYDRQQHGYYYTKAVDQLPGVAVSEAELFALLVAQKAVAQYHGTPFHKPLQTAFDKLTNDLDAKEIIHLQNLGEIMDIRLTGWEDLNEEDFQIVIRAVQQRRPLSFAYRKLGETGFLLRSVHPYQLVCYSNRWYMVGYDLERKDIRAFVVSRMREVEITSGSFERPGNFRIADYLKGSFGIFRGKKEDDFEVVIELDRWAADVMRGRRWHESQQVTDLPGGGMRISFRLNSLEEIQQWVMSWGAHAMVVRPQALADRVVASAVAIQKRYSVPEPSPNGEGQRFFALNDETTG